MKKLTIILTAILFTSCATMKQPNYVYKQELYTVEKRNTFSVTISNDENELKIRDHKNLKTGDSLYIFESYPTVNF